MNMKLANGLLGLCALLIAGQVSAATVSLTPASTTVGGVGDSFLLTVQGSDFANNATAASMNFSWDSTVLAVGGVSLASGFNADGTPGGTLEWQSIGGAIVGPGSLELAATLGNSDIFGNPFPEVGPNFDVMTITFNVIGLPATNPSDVTILACSPCGPWQDGLGNDILDVVYNDATVTVDAIPVPAAAWLFGTGLIGFVGIARRRKVRLA